jgi:hypothetical protein
MSNGHFALVFGKILRSSIWLDDYPTRIMWITMLLLKDKDGIVPKSSIEGLAHTANVKPNEAHAAMAKFLLPDPKSGNQNDDGRRIRDTPDGWFIINHEEYQFSTEAKRLAWAEHKQMQRERERENQVARKAKKNRMLKRIPDSSLAYETAAMKAMERGDMDTVDRLAATPKNGGHARPEVMPESDLPDQRE